MRIILSEVLSTEYAISTPFLALLGMVPVTVYSILDKTVVLQIIGEDDRRVVRHDLVTIDPDRLVARPSPLVDQLHKSRRQGRLNSQKTHDRNGTIEILEDQTDWSEYDPMEELAIISTQDSSEAG